MTDFRRWEQFDADGESAKVDAAAARDEDKEKKQELAGAREAFEQAGIEVAADLAETAVAHARVAALGSSRGRGRRQGRRSAAATPSLAPAPSLAPTPAPEPASAPEPAPPPAAVAPKDGKAAEAVDLNPAAMAAERLTSLTRRLKGLTADREAAMVLLNSSTGREGGGSVGSDLEEALAAFGRLLADVADAECMLPPDLTAIEEEEGEEDSTGGGGGGGGSGGDTGKEGRDAPSSSSRSSSSSSSSLQSASSWNSSLDPAAAAAMRTTVRSVRLDALRGLGTAQLRLGRSAEASDSLKALLLLDPADGEAWRARGDAFGAMGVATLAELHYEQAAVDSDTDCNLSSEAEAAAGEKEQEQEQQQQQQQPSPLPQRARAAALDGLVLFKEQFFRSAFEKFEEGAMLAARCRRRLLAETTPVPPPPTPLPTTAGQPAADSEPLEQQRRRRQRRERRERQRVVRFCEMEVSCRLNAAACCLLRQQDYDAAAAHCTGALNTAATLTTKTTNSSSGSGGGSGGGPGDSAGDEQQPEWVLPCTIKALLRRAEAKRCVGLFQSGAGDLEEARRRATAAEEKDGGESRSDQVLLLRAETERLLEEMRFTASQIAVVAEEQEALT
jgi:tetratricopeptide (TPR) repeat protein